MIKHPLLEVNNLTINTITPHSQQTLLSDVSFSILPNEIIGIVGESGSGKSLTALSIMGLLPKSQLGITKGSIAFDGKLIAHRTTKEMQDISPNIIKWNNRK